MILRSLLALASSAWLVAATSQARNPLETLAIVENPAINTTFHRVNALSSFDLTFDLYQHRQRLKLSLEPNHDVIAHDATVSYLAEDGSIESVEPINRLDHKIYKGVAKVERGDGSWATVGWARIAVQKDGLQPVFEGAFSIHRVPHHIQSRASYVRTKHVLDPDVDPSGDEFMVLWRDSDISKSTPAHTDLKRASERDMSCLSDRLSYNKKSYPSGFTPMLRREESYWGAMSVSSIFGKRQIDTQPVNGNTGGVNLASTIGQTAGCPSTRKVALVGVATDCTYTSSFSTKNDVRDNVIHLMNEASNVWEHTFNISLGLQNLTISPRSCPGVPPASTEWNQPCSSSADIYTRLNLFSAWRATLQDHNSHWTLLTACNTGSAVGLAWLGQSCVNTAFSSTYNGTKETVSGANLVALTGTEWQVIAHETGHTFGAVHDCTSQTCADGTFTAQQCCPLTSSTCDAGEQYIMNPYTTAGITEFSACTIGEVCSAILRNSINTSCLVENTGVVSVSGSHCGNGIVEQGEQCDCGTVEECGSDPCCDPTTCKFTTGSVCDDANEDCCHNCQLARNSTICRASTGECDPAEYCTGKASTCPADKTAPDGQACTEPNVNSAGALQCASGQCTSRDLQCQTVMGSYNHAGNNTYACDSETCSISCASPAFGQGVCYGLQQNFLDGTPCGSGGTCTNGQCEGSSFGKEIASWVDDHKGLVIGLASALGGLLLLLIASCIYRSCKRRKYNKKMAQRKMSPNSSWYNPSMPYGPQGGAYQPNMGMQMPPPAYAPPPIPYAQYEQYGARSPVSPVSPHSPPQSPGWNGPSPNAGLYGGGIIGSRGGPWSPSVQPAAPTRQASMRYA